MSSITPQYTESNLVGTLTQSIDGAATTIYAAFTDRISGDVRQPQSSTKLFVIDKGTESFPNSNYELILASSSSYDSATGITTLTGCTRGLAFYGTSTAGGTGNPHTGGAEIGCVDVHLLWNILVSILDGTNSPPAFKISSRLGYELGGVLGFRQFADSAARDAAITVPQNGDTCILTGSGVAQYYSGGAWNNIGNSATPNGDETTAGKWQGATVAEQGTATDLGGTGAHLVPMNKNLVKTSSGAGDENKIAILDATGKFASGFLPLTNYIDKSIFTAKGSVITSTAASTPTELLVGSDQQKLIADSTQAKGVKWTDCYDADVVADLSTSSAGNNDVPVTTTFLPKLIRLKFFIKGHDSATGSAQFMWSYGEAVYDGTTLKYVSFVVNNQSAASVSALTLGGLYANGITAPFAGAASGTGAIKITLSINSVSSTGFVIRRLSEIGSVPNTGTAEISWEAYA